MWIVLHIKINRYYKNNDYITLFKMYVFFSRLNAPAFYKVSTSSEELKPETQNQCLLGLVPHSIRGFLSSFEHILPATFKYDKCVACSNLVLEEYQNNGMEFLLKVFNSSKYLEDVTKLTDMFNEIDLDEVRINFLGF